MPDTNKSLCKVCDTPFVPGKPNCPKCESPRTAKEQKMAEIFRRGKWRDRLKTNEAQLEERRRRAKRIVSRLVDLPVL